MAKSFYKILFLMIVVFFLVPFSASAIEAVNLEGTVSITHDGTPQYGEIVTADTSLITNNTGTLGFQWTRNSQDISGAVSSSYTLVQSDIGAQIAVKVTSSVQTGTLTSEAITVDKADRAAPAAPTLNTKDKYNVTLNVVLGCEYKIQSGSFSASYEFSGLKSYTEYVFYQRYAETAVYKASPASAGFSVTTDYVVLNNTTCDISTLHPGDGVLVSGSVTLYGTQSIRVKCSTGAKLTLQNAVINVSDSAGQCGIEFTGSGNQLILTGTNRVYSGSTRAGVEALGSLSISGTGSLYAKGGSDGAGIGGGSGQTSGAINITGGIITAAAGTNAAGIGGGKNGSGSAVNISSGLIFAAGSGADDIGGGLSGSQGTLSISGSSAVFLKNNSAPSASTSTHTLYSNETVVQNSAYGYDLPDLWTAGAAAYAYIDYCTVSFQTNGAGAISSIQAGKMSHISAPAEPTKTGVYFGGWYKDAALSNEFNFNSDRVYSDMTLYAGWDVKVAITAGDGGTVSPSGEVYIKQGSNLFIECEPNENYAVAKIISAKQNTITDNGDNTYTITGLDAADTITISFESTILLGSVSIDHDGTPECREKVGVNTTKIENNEGKLLYQWTRDGVDIQGATGEEYILATEDVNHIVGVKVTSTKKDGVLTDIISMKIEKAMKAAPRPPELLEKTTNSITLKMVEGCEYKIDDGDWQESNIFTGLEIETEYAFYQRYAVSSSHKASNQSFSLKVTTYGYNVEMLELKQDVLTMQKGDAKDTGSLFEYYIYPDEAQNKNVHWTSSNNKVIYIDEDTGIIKAMDVGRAVVTITAEDTKNGLFADTCTIQVYGAGEDDASLFAGTITGTLTDENGNLLQGYYITLYSTPRTIKTNSLGEFNFEYIPYANHVLVVENENYEEIGRFVIAMVPGETQSVVTDDEGTIISVMYTEKTLSVVMPIEINNEGGINGIKIAESKEITFISEEEEKTFPKKIMILVLMSVIAAFIIGIGYVLYVGRIQNKGEVIAEFYEPPLIEETIQNDDKNNDE